MDREQAGQTRKSGRPRVEEPRQPVAVLRAVRAYRQWMDGLAESAGLSLSELIAQALSAFADIRGYPRPPRR